jgi:hypothetical protein
MRGVDYTRWNHEQTQDTAMVKQLLGVVCLVAIVCVARSAAKAENAPKAGGSLETDVRRLEALEKENAELKQRLDATVQRLKAVVVRPVPVEEIEIDGWKVGLGADGTAYRPDGSMIRRSTKNIIGDKLGRLVVQDAGSGTLYRTKLPAALALQSGIHVEFDPISGPAIRSVALLPKGEVYSCSGDGRLYRDCDLGRMIENIPSVRRVAATADGFLIALVGEPGQVFKTRVSDGVWVGFDPAKEGSKVLAKAALDFAVSPDHLHVLTIDQGEGSVLKVDGDTRNPTAFYDAVWDGVNRVVVRQSGTFDLWRSPVPLGGEDPAKWVKLTPKVKKYQVSPVKDHVVALTLDHELYCEGQIVHLHVDDFSVTDSGHIIELEEAGVFRSEAPNASDGEFRRIGDRTN